jgi:hypothetical protein
MHDEVLERLVWITGAAPIAPLFAAWLPRRMTPVVIVDAHTCP